MTKALEIAFKSIYGNTLGQKVFNYALKEFDTDRKMWFEKEIRYQNLKIEERSDLEGLEINNRNGSHETEAVFFMTNKK